MKRFLPRSTGKDRRSRSLLFQSSRSLLSFAGTLCLWKPTRFAQTILISAVPGSSDRLLLGSGWLSCLSPWQAAWRLDGLERA